MKSARSAGCRTAAVRPEAAPGAPPRRWQVLLVQCISCVVVLLIAFLLKLAGGSAFDQLREKFNQSIMDNTFAATIAGLFDKEDPSSDPESQDPPPSSDDASSDPEGDASGEGVGGQDVPMSTVKALYAPRGRPLPSCR